MKALLVLVTLVGCVRDAQTWPTPFSAPWGSGHCSPMFAAQVIGCTYTDELQRVSHEVCFESERGSWWCSGRRTDPAPCALCRPRPSS